MIDLSEDRLGSAGDQFYERLLKAHSGLDAEASQRLNMRLVLLMANAIGRPDVLEALLKAAKGETDD